MNAKEITKPAQAVEDHMQKILKQLKKKKKGADFTETEREKLIERIGKAKIDFDELEANIQKISAEKEA